MAVRSSAWTALLVAAAAQGPALQDAIDAAIAAGQPSFTLQPGMQYSIVNMSLSVADAANFVLDGAGATLAFTPGFGFVVNNASSILVQNLSVTYSPTCFTQGIVVAVNAVPHSVDVQLDPGYPRPTASYFDTQEIKLQFFDSSPGARRIPGQSEACLVSVVGEVSPGVWRFNMNRGAWTPPLGARSSISPRIGAHTAEIPDFYRGQAWWVHRSQNVTSQDVNLYGSGNFAVLDYGGNGGNTYLRFHLGRDPNQPTNLLSSNTDGFHAFSTGVAPRILESSFEFHGDDALNYHSRVALVLATQNMSSGSGTAWIVDVSDVPSPNPDDPPARTLDDLVLGDMLQIFSPQENLRGNLSVQSIAVVTDPSVIAQAQALVKALPSVTVNPAAVQVWSVGLTGKGIAQVQRSDLVQFARRTATYGLVADSSFTDSYDSCFRAQGSHLLVTNVTYARNPGGITVVYDPGWLEGAAGLTNVSFLNNTFIDIGAPPYAHAMSDILTVDPKATDVVTQGNVFEQE